MNLIHKPKLFTLYDFQTAESGKCLRGIQTKRGSLLTAGTGTGKTFYTLSELKEAQDLGLIGGKGGLSLKFADILILTKKSVKIQTNRVAKLAGLESYYVESYDALRSNFGELAFIEWRSEWTQGSMELVPYWTEEQRPDIIWCDECQTLKNPKSLAAKCILQAIKQGITVVFSSATPFVTIAESEVVCKGLRVVSSNDNDRSWRDLAYDLSGATKPNELNHEAIKRLNDLLEDRGQLIKFHNIHYKHRAVNKQKIIPFEKPEHRVVYNAAFDEYQEIRAKANLHTLEGLAMVFVAMLKFRQVAELLRAGILARLAAESIAKGDCQIIIASNFVPTLRAVWEALTKVHGIAKEDIGFLIGSVTNIQERQRAIDNFQSGKSKIFLCTLKAGGVGISLHHERPSAKPRIVFLPPTWSAIELVQMLGRAHRINSLSTTHQFVVWFQDTIEEQVAERVAQKIKCLKEIVTKRETWVDLFNQPAQEGLVLKGGHKRPSAIEIESEIVTDTDPLASKLRAESEETDEEGNTTDYAIPTEVDSEVEVESGESDILFTPPKSQLTYNGALIPLTPTQRLFNKVMRKVKP